MTTTANVADPAAVETRNARPSLRTTLGGAVGMVFVGGSVAVSGLLHHAPVDTVQAVRYALASVVLVAVARRVGVAVRLPVGAEWFWLAAVTVTGLIVFNLALVAGTRHAEPAVLAVAVASVPIVLGVIGPLIERRRPELAMLAAAALVTAGAILVEGFGHADAIGLAWALVVLSCEAGFTLLAIPVLRTLGPWGVSVHTTWLAAMGFAVLGLMVEGPTAVLRFTGRDLAAIGYLALCVTAAAFVLWYGCVSSLGAGRAGLLTGIAPVAAALTGTLLGSPLPGPAVWTGMLVVAGGLALGLLRGSG